MTVESDSCYLELLVEQSSMNTDRCNIDVQFGTASSVNSVNVRACQTLPEAVRFILFNNKNQNNNQILTDSDGRIFDLIEQFPEYPQKMFTNLIKHFTELYDTDLYIINFDKKKFDLFNKDNYLRENSKANMAFLSFNEDNMVCGPLCITIDNETTHTIFSCDDFCIWDHIDNYLEELNKSKLESTTNSIQMVQHQNMIDAQDSVENTTTVDPVLVLEDQSNLANAVEADDKAESRILIEEMLKPISHLFGNLSLKTETISSVIHSSAFDIGNLEHLSHRDTIIALKNQFRCLSDLTENIEQSISILQNDETTVHQSPFSDNINNRPQHSDTSVEMNYALQAVPLSTNTSTIPIPVSTNLSNSVEVTNTSILPEPTALTIYLDPPILTTEVKNEWHSRTIKELKAHKNPLLRGEGSQRSPILVQVPVEGETSTYLGIAVWTYDNQNHISKVAVGENTKVKGDYPLKDNNLDCLEFDEHNSMTFFDRTTKYNYSKITSEEHKARLKEIRLHIFNLYQYGIITKELIHERQLNIFKLALWFCYYQNGEYKRVSPISVTRTIREKCVAGRQTKNISEDNPANNP